MKKIMNAVQSVLIAMILLAIIGTGVILYFQMHGQPAEETEPVVNVSINNTTNISVSDNSTTSGNDIANITIPESTDHDYTANIIAKATCTKDGAVQYICKDCGDYYIAPIKAEGHKPTDWVVVTKATEEKDGLKRKTCKVCKRVLEEEIISKDSVKDSHVHKYTPSITTPETCTTQGVITYKCECGKTYTESIPATNHPSRQTIRTEPTCGKEGSVITSCAECDAIISHDTLPASDHEFGAWTVTTKATATTEGTKTRTCKFCGHEETAVIPATTASGSNHKHKYNSSVTTEETCTVDGVITYTCTSCDDSYTESIPALGHAPGNWIVTTEATESSTGLRQKFCRRCGEITHEEIIPMIEPEHVCIYGTPVITRQPTCTKTGTRKYTCIECGLFYTSKIDKLPHDLNSSGVCRMCGKTFN